MKNFFFFILATVYLSCQPSVRYSSKTDSTVEPEVREQHRPAEISGFIREWLNTPYRFGGTSKTGIDCSGLTMQFMQSMYGIQLPHQAQDQYEQGKRVIRTSLQPGNLVFFAAPHGGKVNHVGIYIGEGKFLHASESEGVIISDLRDPVFASDYVGACHY